MPEVKAPRVEPKKPKQEGMHEHVIIITDEPVRFVERRNVCRCQTPEVDITVLGDIRVAARALDDLLDEMEASN